MAKPLLFMYSGQGSQYYQMGRDLFQGHAGFRSWMRALNVMAADVRGESILAHMYNEEKKKSDPFDDILFSHPAIFMVEYALTRVLMEEGIVPDCLVGVSLGELVCAAVAGIMNVEDAVEAVVRQSQIFHTHCRNGGMAAVLHDVNIFNEVPLISGNCELAGVNFHSHFVISGRRDNLERVMRYLKQKDIICQPLPLQVGFHSSCIDGVREDCLRYFRRKEYRSPLIPVYSCSSLRRLSDVGASYFWDVIRKPMMFRDTMAGLEETGGHAYLDVSPMGTLATFAKYNITGTDSSSHFIMSPYARDMNQYEKVSRALKNST